MLHVHAHSAPVFQEAALEALSGSLSDHVQTTLLARPPDIRRFAAQGRFVKVSLRHPGYYILHVFLGYAKIFLYETITERTEKWATPTFLLVIHSAAL
jgi:hypothetical protein